MANLEIREEIKKSRLFHYEIADVLGVLESAFSKWLRSEMDAERKGYASNQQYKGGASGFRKIKCNENAVKTQCLLTVFLVVF